MVRNDPLFRGFYLVMIRFLSEKDFHLKAKKYRVQHRIELCTGCAYVIVFTLLLNKGSGDK